MVISCVKIEWISDFKGYGLIATQPIPKGTITFAQDGLDIVIPSYDLDKIDKNLFEYVEKYSYEDFLGNRIISWDLGKYMNHDDQANTLSTGYGFEVAVRDIEVGEEVTDDYRIFSTHHDTSFGQTVDVLKGFRPWPEDLLQVWDQKVISALTCIHGLSQPLLPFIQPEIWGDVLKLKDKPSTYRSVSEALPLRYKLQMEGIISEPVDR